MLHNILSQFILLLILINEAWNLDSSFFRTINENLIEGSHICLRVKRTYRGDMRYPYYSRFQILNESSHSDFHLEPFDPGELPVEYISGKTIMPECYWQGMNPAHYLFGLSLLYEWSIGINQPPALQFDRVAFFKCIEKSSVESKWNWGKVILDTIFSSWNNSRLLTSCLSTETFLDPPRYKQDSFVCFEKLYISYREFVLFDSIYAVKMLQKILPGKMTQSNKSDGNSVDMRCKSSTLRIRYYQRQKGSAGNRVISNLDEALEIGRKYSTDVATFSTTALTSFAEQSRLFNEFDILVSTSGSQLANMVLVRNKDVGFIEVGVVVRDLFWKENALQLGFKSYLYSNGHYISPSCKAQEHLVDCIDPGKALGSNEKHAVFCPDRQARKNRWDITNCPFAIDKSRFESVLKKSIDRVCRDFGS